MITKLLLIGAGGFIGSVARYLMSVGVATLTHGNIFPWGTLSVNILGCLAVGFIGGLAELKGMFSNEIRVFLLVGIMGGFTTFSTFGYETFQLFRNGEGELAMYNIGLSVIAGVLSVWAGFILARQI